uniref:F-box domain-containing protein n=1 Tax=Psilocybe cubensis TaxID=181762 RepID=A0A8H7XUT7_PSICU
MKLRVRLVIHRWKLVESTVCGDDQKSFLEVDGYPWCSWASIMTDLASTSVSPFVSVTLSSTSDQNSTDNAVQAIDREIRELKTRRNDLIPIAKLPPEVLSRVFHIVRQDSRFTQWVKLSFVCRRWRGVALDTPSFWDSPPLLSPHWTEECLSRSKMSNLTLNFPYHKPASNQRIASLSKILRQHSSRIREINFALTHGSCEIGNILSLLPKSLPCLESFSLEVNLLTRAYHPQYNPLVPLQVPDDSLHEMERIRSLKMIGVGFNWKAHLPNTLTELKLSDIPHSCLPTLTQFWNAMKNMPLLHSLSLKDAFPEHPGGTLLTEKINFHHLQNLSISASSMKQIEMFLAGVSFPPTIVLNIACCEQANLLNLSTHHELFSTMAYVVEGNTRPLQLDVTLPLLSTGRFGLKIDVYSDSVLELHKLEFHREPLEYPVLSFSTGGNSNWSLLDDYDQALTELFNALPLEETIQLRIRDSTRTDPLSPQTILQTFGCLPRLEALALRPTPNYLSALKTTLPVIPSEPQRPSSAISFPSLHSITVVDTDFDLNKYDMDTSISTKRLLDCLTWRCENDAKLQNVRFRLCTRLSKKVINTVSVVVGNVDWDEAEKGFVNEEQETDEEVSSTPCYDDYDDYTFYHDSE